jgi:hypothetical protein
MRRLRGKRRSGLVAAAILLLAAAPGEASPRTWEPLVLHGRQMGALVGTPIARLEARRRAGAAPVPIPFQLDKVLPDGRVAAPHGPEPEPAAHSDLLGNPDELVLMISDLGRRIRSAAELPAGALELELDDPLGGAPRYAYLASVDAPQRSHANYVDYDAALDQIESQHYRFGMTKGNVTDLALQDAMGDAPPNLIDRFKIRIRATILKFFRYHVDEDDIETRLLAYRDGHLRVIRRVTDSARIGLGLSSPEVKSSDYFYRDLVQTPFRVKFPWVPNAVFGDVHVRLYYDFLHLDGFQLLYSDMPGAPIRIGLPASEQQIRAAPEPLAVRWLALRGQGRTLVQMLIPAPDATAVTRRLFYLDSSKPDPPERVPGNHPGVGYELTGWQDLSRGAHHFRSVLVSVDGSYDPQTVLDEISTPPKVRIHPVARPAPSAGS